MIYCGIEKCKYYNSKNFKNGNCENKKYPTFHNNSGIIICDEMIIIENKIQRELKLEKW